MTNTLTIKQIRDKVLVEPASPFTNIDELVEHFDRSASIIGAFYLSEKDTRRELASLWHELDTAFLVAASDFLKIPEDAKLRKLVTTLAWDWGHSCGYRDVVSYLDDLADVIKATLETK